MILSPLLRLAAPVAFIFLLAACTKEHEPIKTGTITDPRDGHVYKTVTINNDTWLAENLAYLPLLKVRTIHGVEKDVPDGTVCIYDYIGESIDEAKRTENYQIYGCLYRISDGTIDSLCPEGWHMSTDKEWERLEKIAGTDSAGSLKLRSVYGWTDGRNGTDDLGLGILPGGAYSTDGDVFTSLGVSGNFATSGTMIVWKDGFLHRTNITRSIAGKVYRFGDDGYFVSVRCVKDH